MILWDFSLVESFYTSIISSELNNSGTIKLSKDHNSVILFYKGVPVNNSLDLVLRLLRF